MSKPRTVNFSVIFKDLEAAREFQSKVQNTEIRVVIDDERLVVEGDPGEWVDVTVSLEMTPSYASVSEFEAMLDRFASPLGGRNDGWGCFSVE